MANIVLKNLDEKIEKNGVYVPGEAATYGGVVQKSSVMLLLVVAAAFGTWITGYAMNPLTVVVSAIMGAIAALIICFRPTAAPLLAPLYALLEGMALAAISYSFEMRYPGIAMNAVLATFGIFLTTLFMYSRSIVTVDEKFTKGVVTATIAVFLVYMADMVAGLFGVHIPMIHQSGPVGIIFSLVVIGIATANLFLDFELVHKAVEERAPKYFEWYCAFGLTVTLIWLYVEILNLLRKLRN
jgi:uncharacterized YccA/Bax inhibitor family protein